MIRTEGGTPSYLARRGARTGATIWRAVSRGPEKDIAPDGVMDLMWFRERLVVAGADTRTMSFETRPGEVTWGLRLPPGVAHALFGLPADELTDRRRALSHLVTPPPVAEASFATDAPAALEQVFLDLWRRADPDRSVLRLAASLDRAARDGLGVRETATIHDLSERSLRRLSHTLFGYGPRSLAQIHRFRRALDLVRSGRSLGAAAAAAGYADQSHFTRECKRLTGRTPSVLASVTT